MVEFIISRPFKNIQKKLNLPRQKMDIQSILLIIYQFYLYSKTES